MLRWRRQIFTATTIVNGKCGETNFQYCTLVWVYDICVRAGNRQTPTSGGVNVAATRNSISRSCSNAFGAARRSPGPPGYTILFPETGSRSWIPKRDWKLSDEVRESGQTRAHVENQATQTFAEQLSQNFIDSAPVRDSNGKLGKFAYPASLG